MSNGIKVKKRNGRGMESLNLEKMHKMCEEATKGIAGVSASQVEIQSGIQFYDGITTGEIQEILIRSASDLISLDNPNYQYVAARLLLFSLRKNLYHRLWEHPKFIDQIKTCIKQGVYDKDIFTKYSKEEIEKANNFIDHDRDFLFTYAGLRQVVDKYLVQDRSDQARKIRKIHSSEKIDQILTHRWLGPGIFIGLLYFIFQSIFNFSTKKYRLLYLSFGFRNKKTTCSHLLLRQSNIVSFEVVSEH